MFKIATTNRGINPHCKKKKKKQQQKNVENQKSQNRKKKPHIRFFKHTWKKKNKQQ